MPNPAFPFLPLLSYLPFWYTSGLGVGTTVAYAAYFAAGYRDLNL